MKEIVNGRTSNLFCIPEPYRNVKFTVLKHLVRRMFVFTPKLKGYYCTTLSVQTVMQKGWPLVLGVCVCVSV